MQVASLFIKSQSVIKFVCEEGAEENEIALSKGTSRVETNFLPSTFI